MKIPFRTLDLRTKGHVVGCGVQGNKCLALDLSMSRNGKWSVNWSLAGNLGDETFASELARKTGGRHFWVSPTEEGGLQIEATRVIEIPDEGTVPKAQGKDFFMTQIKNRFVDETIVFGGMRMRGADNGKSKAVKGVHNVGGGAIKDNIKRDYHNWYSVMGIRRPHIASTALAIANAYLALYPIEKRLANPLRLIILKGRSVYRSILMDDWKYIDEIILPRMDGDDASKNVIDGRVQGWINYFKRLHPMLLENRTVCPLVIAVKESHVSDYEHWDLWGEYAMERINMTEEVAEPILLNRDIAPVAFGMALQGGC